MASPMTTVAKGLVGRIAILTLSGGQQITGTVEKVAQDGHALKLRHDTHVHYVDTDHISAISVLDKDGEL